MLSHFLLLLLKLLTFLLCCVCLWISLDFEDLFGVCCAYWMCSLVFVNTFGKCTAFICLNIIFFSSFMSLLPFCYSDYINFDHVVLPHLPLMFHSFFSALFSLCSLDCIISIFKFTHSSLRSNLSEYFILFFALFHPDFPVAYFFL